MMNTFTASFPVLQEWLLEHERKHGRPLRVLHIGNIANNAYVNAKIMRRQGIEADVLCLNYYHIMGCPEWEDAEIEGDVGDPNLPDWWSVNLHGYKRPSWFVQGPTRMALEYLDAVGTQNLPKVIFWKLALDAVRRAMASRNLIGIYIYRALRKLLRLTHIIPRVVYHARHGELGAVIWRKLMGHSISNPEGNGVQVLDNKHEKIEFLFGGLRSDDVAGYMGHDALWEKVLKHYDIVQGYATDGIYPLLHGHANYTTYEHGTLRTIPFDDNAQGRMCASVYKNSKHSFVTNLDCMEAARKLSLEEEKFTALPHAFDSSKVNDFLLNEGAGIEKAISPPTFIAPARQHWRGGGASWCKGNDIIIHAIKILDDAGLNFSVIFVEWGEDVPASKSLIKELDVGHHVKWVEPMSKKELWATYLASVGVIDQFFVPAFGGVTFEALSLGVPVLSRLDEVAAFEFFGVSPPMVNVATAGELAGAMMLVIENPQERNKIGHASREWAKTYHSSDVILAKQLNVYSKIVKARVN